MHEKEFKAKRQQPLLAVYSQSGVKSFYLDQQGSSISFFRTGAAAPLPCPGEGRGAAAQCKKAGVCARPRRIRTSL